LPTALLAVVLLVSGAQGATYHVATNGSDAATGADWEHAFLTIPKAISTAVNGDQVLVSNGTYNITGRILVNKGLTIRSWNNGALDPEGTAVRRPSEAGNYRIFELDHADALLQGFTITNGNYASGGGVVMRKGSALEDCIVSGNASPGHGGGVLVEATGGFLRNCIFAGNTAVSYGGGLHISMTGLVENCIFTGNSASRGGGFHSYRLVSGGFRNCLVSDNSASGYGGGTGVDGGTLENCTITGNTGSGGGGGIYLDFRVVPTVLKNCIVYGNDANGLTTSNYIHQAGTVNPGGGYSYTNCLLAPVPAWLIHTDCFDADPRFVDPDKGNYRLREDSACVDAGLNLPWMADARDLDGARRIQPVDDVVDIGCYELPQWSGTLLLLR
jgi:hypothetical protein